MQSYRLHLVFYNVRGPISSLVPVVPYILNIVVVVQSFEQQTHLLDVILVSERGVGRGHLLCLSRNNIVTHTTQCLCNSTYLGRVSGDLNAAILEAEIIRTTFKDVLHSLILIDIAVLVVDNDDALKREHERHTARCTHITAELVEVMPYLTCCSVSVICKAVNDDRNAVGTVSLVDAVLVIVLFSTARSLFQKSVDVVVGNVVGLCLLDELCELCVVCTPV